MALALNNLKKVDMQLNKETKPNTIAELAGTAEYTDCISAESYSTPPMSVLRPNQLEQQNISIASLLRGKALPTSVLNLIVRLHLGNAEYLFIAITPRSTLAWSGST